MRRREQTQWEDLLERPAAGDEANDVRMVGADVFRSIGAEEKPSKVASWAGGHPQNTRAATPPTLHLSNAELLHHNGLTFSRDFSFCLCNHLGSPFISSFSSLHQRNGDTGRICSSQKCKQAKFEAMDASMCPICLCPYSEDKYPMMFVPCMHSICCNCLLQVEIFARVHLSFPKCAKCRAPIHNSHKNFELMSLAEEHSKIK